MHTPHSVLHSEFGDDFDRYARTLLQEAVSNGIAAIGITDYFSVDGYREMRNRLSDERWLSENLDGEAAEQAKRLLLLPNVELRSTPIRTGETDSRVNLHVLFADTLAADEINTYFLQELRFTAISAPDARDERWPITMANLADLGAKLKLEHDRFTGSDVEVGMMNAVVSHEDVTDVLQSHASRFRRDHLVVMPIDEDLSDISWDGQGHHTRKLFIQKSDMLFSSNAGTRAFGLGQRHPNVADFIREFGGLKPCLHGSDAHSYERLFRPDGERHTWIKADPTWMGLRQLLNEPEHRVFIGAEPPEITRGLFRAANVIERVAIKRSPDATTPDSWFDCEVPLNSGLCAVIGNRGSGKSALADVIGLVGNTRRTDSFSFLTADRFRNARTGRAGQFEATIRWVDGTLDGPITLSDNPSSAAVEKVRYIAQGYLEEICNEVSEGERSRFYAELQSVIFSHVSQADRQDFETLGELLRHLGEGTNERIRSLQEELRQTDAEIVQAQRHLELEHRQGLEARLAEIERRLQAHERAEPEIVPAPAAPESSGAADGLAQELAAARGALVNLDEQLRLLRNEDASLSRRQVAGERLIERLRTLETTLARRLEEMEPDASVLDLELADLVTVRVDLGPLDIAMEETRARRAEIADLLDGGNAEGPTSQRASAATQVRDLEDQLSLPERQHRESTRRHEEWESARAAIVGDRNAPGTLEHARAQLADLDAIPQLLAELKDRRAGISLDIHRAKDMLRAQYERYHKPVSDFLRSSEVALVDAFKLDFSASIAQSGFADTLLGFIDQRKSGPYARIDRGHEKLSSFLASVDWTDADAVLSFADSVVSEADTDGRRLRLADQLVQGATEEAVLDYVYGLDYLSPVYKLTWDGRGVDELSPGERGNLLLIFYLLVDQSVIPLVIDQPEENLDNQTVVDTLVPGTRHARQRRQVVLITHNPNLAVVCDADQIIYAEMDKHAGYSVTYDSGSIENPRMNKRLVDVLEGTMPAFDKRAAKYIGHDTR